MKLFLAVIFLFVLYRKAAGQAKVHVYVTTPMTCANARKYCQANYTDLSTITAEEDVQMFQTVAGGGYGPSWFNSLNLLAGGACALMNNGESKNQIFWSTFCGAPTLLCTKEQPFFCYKTLTVVQKSKTWEEALNYCRFHYYDLAHLDYEVLPNLSSAQTDSVWTGLRFLAGNWFWVGKENSETSVAVPSCPPEPYRCGALNSKTGKWENSDCEKQLNFICI